MNAIRFNEFIEEQKDIIFRAGEPAKLKFNVVLDEALRKNLATDKYFGAIYRLQKYFDALGFLRRDKYNIYLQLCKEAEACKEAGDTIENAIVDTFAWAAVAYKSISIRIMMRH